MKIQKIFIMIVFFITLTKILTAGNHIKRVELSESLIKRDLTLIYQTAKQLDASLDFFHKEVKELFEKIMVDQYYIPTSREKKNFDSFWNAFFDLRVVLYSIYNTYDEREKVGLELQTKVDFLKHACKIYLVSPGVEVVYGAWGNSEIKRKLNEKRRNIPEGYFLTLENEVFSQFHEIQKEDEILFLFPKYSLNGVSVKDLFNNNSVNMNDETLDKLKLLVLKREESLLKYEKFIKNFQNWLTLKIQNLEYKFKDIIYRRLKKIETWIGDTKLKRRNADYHNGETLITLEQTYQLDAIMEPGDFGLSRTNWFLSNAFLPGFWPHSFLYVGDESKLQAYFDYDIETINYFYNKCLEENIFCSSFTEYLSTSTQTQKAWLDYIKMDSHEFKKIIIEAVSDGVVFSSARYTLLNDFIAVLRPRLSVLDKALSVLESFKSFGIEYDFDFDFRSDDKLVCSELLTKSYESDYANEKRGVDFNYDISKKEYYEIYMNKLILAPIKIVEKTFDENVLGKRPSQLEFVTFLKGVESEGGAVFESENLFYQTLTWPKWSFMQD